MEIVSLGLEALQSVVEHAASYRLGQSVVRLFDRALWVVEKCARWAVPPPLEQDERPPQTLVRPLPWVFFLVMLVTLRVAREAISLANLVMGKPPLRSADVVVFIQSKRRYLRTLKYQGNRIMRARSSAPAQQPWYRGLHSLFQLTMCFRKESHNYGNNNNTSVVNNDEVVVIKRNNPGRGGRQESPAAAAGETTMERLIEKIMVDLDAESDEDNIEFTNASSKNDRSECTESDQDTMCETSTPVQSQDTEISHTNGDDIHFSPNKNKHSSSTPEKQKDSIATTENSEQCDLSNTIKNNTDGTFEISYLQTDLDKTVTENSSSKNNEEKRKLEQNITGNIENSHENNSMNVAGNSSEDSALPPSPDEKTLSPKQISANLIENEASSQNSRRTNKKDNKIANGRTVKSVPSKKKGVNHQRQNTNEPLPQRVLPSNSSF